jgi:hypothetical protein
MLFSSSGIRAPVDVLTGMESRLQDGDTVVLQHVEEGRLAGIVKTEEKQLGVLVQESKVGEDIVD